ncbi:MULTISPECIES: carbohydrate ABC transporter permease [Rhodococcus]|uniref:Carbohydrate ABC transporter permease n=1 Tax=Rhodococcus baikonurensis TaxID=172041 RepID=A0ABV5XRT3_9NOCA
MTTDTTTRLDIAETGTARRTKPFRSVAGHLVLGAITVFSLVPIIWMYVTALRPRDDALAQSVLPTGISLDNLRAASDLLPLGGLIGNTTVMAAAVALFQLFSALLAAYAFGCWRFRGDRVLFLIFVATWLVPFQITMLPNYVLLSDLGWLNTLTGVIVPQITAPFAVLLLRQHMRSFPRELLDAARMDGRSHWNTLWTVVVPSMRGPLAALAILLFVTAWNEYFWPLLVLSDPASVAQIGLRSLITEAGTDYGAMMAAAGALCLPILAVYLVLQRQVVNAFVRSGLR